MIFENVIFDFDGTIVNSHPGILAAFDKAFLKLYGKKNTISITPFIGPPITEILSKVNGETDKGKINLFINYFKEDYDTENFKESYLYAGMEDLLKQLVAKKIKLFLATNKREKPTRLITEYLSLNNYFCGVYCSDLQNKNYASKNEMINDLLTSENLDRKKTVLIGDTSQDKLAAEKNDIQFIYAAYGFGDLQKMERTIFKPLDVLNFIN